MAEFIDLTGFKFNMLKVLQLDCGGHGLRLKWECICDCGNKCIVTGYRLTTGHTQSCGCLRNKQTFENLVGHKFNLLTVTSFHGKINGKIKWNCICDCGNYSVVRSSNLKNGCVKSCGCLSKLNHSKSHGLKNTRLYNIWDNMKGRCYRPSVESFKNYGAMGIKICDEWLNDCNKFFQWAMDNGYNDSLSIERDDVSKNYEPNNCRWIPPNQQSQNRRDTLGRERVLQIKLLIKSGTMFHKDIAIMYNVSHTTIMKISTNRSYKNILLPQ